MKLHTYSQWATKRKLLERKQTIGHLSKNYIAKD